MDELFGYIERITFQNSESGFTVAWLKAPRVKDLICVVGEMGHISPGETVRCQGKWDHHLVHGRQFQVDLCELETPADCLGIKKYLGSGLVKGIGPKYAEKIVSRFGEETLRMIDTTPEKLLEVEGIGKKRMEMIKGCWQQQRAIRDLMIFLQGINISPGLAQKVFKVYGDQSVKVIKENPYSLAKQVFGIGFKSADNVALKMGIEKDSSRRIEAGIDYALTELASDGNTCYPITEFLIYASELLDVSKELVSLAIESLRAAEEIRLGTLDEEEYIWLKSLFISEMGISKELKRLNTGESPLRTIDVEKALDWVQKKLEITLAKNQLKAVQKGVTNKCHIITGGPGTGKSTITKSLLEITKILTSKILLAAPTGRAAKRMSEITGWKATTLHSLLEVDFKTGGFKRGSQNPLDCDLLICDEASMIDTHLMYHLLKAIPTGARVIFVGDINQLPSVGPGNVLKDIIESKQVSTTILNEIFRQAAGSKIITNAHRINDGIFPDVKAETEGDFFFLEHEDPEELCEALLRLVVTRLPQKYQFDGTKDIQVLAPMKKGVIGTENLNRVLQEKLNPHGRTLIRGGRTYRIGDKVMQTRNNYQKEVFNGDMGIVSAIDETEQKLTITIDGRGVDYDFSDLDEITLAYAVSIHKSQGSEYPCVVIPVHTTHFMMLHRNLLYTGVTRGKKLVVLLGTMKALAMAVKNDQVKKRFTGLKMALLGKVEQKAWVS